MANIRPLLNDAFDDLFKGFFVQPVRYGAEEGLQIKMDVKEDDKSYTVHADIPGVKKEDIKVSVEGNLVSISAEVKREKEDKEGEKVIHSERYVGRVSRSFTLAMDVNMETATAKYADGVLELVLPKKASPSSKHLNIQ